MDLVLLGEGGGDVAFAGDGCLLKVGLSSDLGRGEGCLLECLVVFDVDLVPLEGDVGDGPLCLDVDLAL